MPNEALEVQFRSVTVPQNSVPAVAQDLEALRRQVWATDQPGPVTVDGTYYPVTVKKHLRAQEIAAQNDVDSKRRALQLVAGKEYSQLKPLRGDVRLSPPTPNDMQSLTRSTLRFVESAKPVGPLR